MNDRGVILGQLYALRAQVDCLIGMIEPEPAPESSACRHPEEQRIDTTTAGGPRRFLCGVCEQEFDGVAPV